MNKIKGAFLSLIIVSFIILNFLYTKEIFSGIHNGLLLCINAVVPSLFVFMILSNIIINSSAKNIITIPFLKKPLRLSKTELSIFILSLIGGYPIGARLLANEIDANRISKKKPNE